jgi:FAD/FMN-containing dehydrogenase
MHPTFCVPHGDEDAMARTMAAFDDIIDATLDLGGTITGEHGIGRIKGRYLAREIGAANYEVQRAIKNALDPRDLLNPGRWI